MRRLGTCCFLVIALSQGTVSKEPEGKDTSRQTCGLPWVDPPDRGGWAAICCRLAAQVANQGVTDVPPKITSRGSWQTQ